MAIEFLMGFFCKNRVHGALMADAKAAVIMVGDVVDFAAIDIRPSECTVNYAQKDLILSSNLCACAAE